MNRIKYIYLLLLVTLISACSKTMELESLTFDALLAQERVKVGEEITFDLSGNANVVTFYSGEMGNDYAYREGRTLELNDPQISFASDAWFGNERGQISVLVSTEFNGEVSRENVQASFDAGEWIDITDEFPLPESNHPSGAREQGVANGPFGLSDIVTAEKKGIYFAFRNRTVGGGAPTQWTFSRFMVTANSPLGRQTLATAQTGGWETAALGAFGTSSFGPNASGTSIWFPRGNQPYPAYDNWIISRKIEVSSLDLGADPAEPIKSYADPQMTEFKYTYYVPGVYVATFLASNVNAQGEIQVVKQVKVVVEP